MTAIHSTTDAQPIDNPTVFVLASEVAEEVELIREVMGRSFDDSPRLPASNVSQLEAYFQAQTLFRKANQLAQEIAGVPRLAATPLPEAAPQPADTHAVILQAREQVRLVSDALGIDTEVAVVPIGSASVTGVFMTIIDLNRQLNLLLDTPIAPSDVFEQVSLAVLYCAGILSTYGVNDIPPPEPFDGYRRPGDVYALLLQAIDQVSDISRDAGVDVLRLSTSRNIPDDIEPGHVYDIARILVSMLAMLADAVDADEVFPTLEEPLRIFPTQVYERATILERQLVQLAPLI
jgi:hypothetical protein